MVPSLLWANEEIGDFELNIDMGPSAFFSVPNTFFENLEPANWKVTGIGRMGKEDHKLWGAPFRMARTVTGKVQLKRVQFRPEYDLFIAEWQKFNEVNIWGGAKDHPFREFGQILAGKKVRVTGDWYRHWCGPMEQFLEQGYLDRLVELELFELAE